MNFLVITDELQLESLSPELKRLYEMYQKILSKRTLYQTIRPFKDKRPSVYNEQCKRLAATVRYITYRVDRQCFDVRPTVNGKRVWLGSEKDFDNACWLLSEYLKLKI